MAAMTTPITIIPVRHWSEACRFQRPPSARRLIWISCNEHQSQAGRASCIHAAGKHFHVHFTFDSPAGGSNVKWTWKCTSPEDAERQINWVEVEAGLVMADKNATLMMKCDADIIYNDIEYISSSILKSNMPPCTYNMSWSASMYGQVCTCARVCVCVC